jgi:hypothetical protein
MAAIPRIPGETPPAPLEYADPVEKEEAEPIHPGGSDEPEEESVNLPPIVDPEGEIEELEDRSLPIERVLWAENRAGDRIEQTYVQKGLTWFGKLELYGLLGQAVKVVLEGDNPLGIGSILDMAQNPRQMVNDLMGNLPGADTAPDRQQDDQDLELEAGKVLAAFAQVVSIAPELLSQAYCVALAIPKTHRQWAVEWAFPNMDDEMGQDILHTFIAQNWGVMEDFFAKELRKILKRIMQERAKASAGRR